MAPSVSISAVVLALVGGAALGCARSCPVPAPGAQAQPVASAEPTPREELLAPYDPDPGAEMTLTDAQIVTILATAHAAELDQANAAFARSSRDPVRAFARHMVEDQSRAGGNFQELAAKKSLSTREESETRQDLERNGTRVLARLQAPGASFDREFMDAEIEGHRDLLALLDRRLIPAAKDADLLRVLNFERSVVVEQLEDAREIESTMSSSPVLSQR